MNKFFLKLFLPCMAIFVIENNVMGETTNLMEAIRDKQSPAVIKNLITQGADVNAVDSEFLRCVKPVLRYALDRGCDKNSVEIIKMLITAGADVNQETYNRVPDQQVYGFMPLLTYAAIYSSAEIVQMFIDAGAQNTVPPEFPLTFNKTALEIARKLGKTDIIKILE